MPPRTWRGTPAKRRFISSLPKTPTAQRRPAMWNAFDAELSVSVRAAISGESDANGTKRAPESTRSAWISSLITMRSFASAISAIASSSARA